MNEGGREGRVGYGMGRVPVTPDQPGGHTGAGLLEIGGLGQALELNWQ